jgi:hypothetical protein
MNNVWTVAGLLAWGLLGAVGCANGTQEKDDGGERSLDSGETTRPDAAPIADSSTDTGSRSSLDAAGVTDSSANEDAAPIAVCSLTSTSPCPNGSTCSFAADTIACTGTLGTGVQGDACSSMQGGCEAGYICAGSPSDASAGTCLAWCELNGPDTCPTDTTCTQTFLPSPMSGSITYGTCR